MPTDGRPGGAGFTRATTVPTDAVIPFVVPSATPGEKDQDITFALLKQQLGEVPASPFSITITGDGTTLEHPVTHNLGTYDVVAGGFFGSGTGRVWRDLEFTPTTVNAGTVRINQSTGTAGALANAAEADVVVWEPGFGFATLVPVIVPDAGASLALTGDVSEPVSTIATVSQDLTVTVDAVGKQVVTAHFVGDGTARTITWAGDTLAWEGGAAVTAVPASGRLVVQFADHGDGVVLATSGVFS